MLVHIPYEYILKGLHILRSYFSSPNEDKKNNKGVRGQLPGTDLNRYINTIADEWAMQNQKKELCTLMD